MLMYDNKIQGFMLWQTLSKWQRNSQGSVRYKVYPRVVISTMEYYQYNMYVEKEVVWLGDILRISSMEFSSHRNLSHLSFRQLTATFVSGMTTRIVRVVKILYFNNAHTPDVIILAVKISTMITDALITKYAHISVDCHCPCSR